MKKRYWIALGFILCAVVCMAQGGFLSGAYFINPTTLGTLPMCNQFSGGLCVYSPSGVVDNGTILTYKGSHIVTQGTNLNPVAGTGTYTTATSDTFTITGATSSSHCVAFATNATAAAATVIPYVSAVGTNSVTITHSATTASGGTVNVICTLN